VVSQDLIKRRIELKRQLIFLVGREIEALQRELDDQENGQESQHQSASDRNADDPQKGTGEKAA